LTAAPGDRRSVAAGALVAAALIAHQVAGKATRDALFLSSFTVETLPFAITISAAVSLVAVGVFARAMARFTPGRVVPWALWTGLALLVAQWGLAGRYPRAAAIALYLHMAFFGATLVSGFWSLVNERWDPHAAKRAIARIGAGASLGGVVGGGLAAGMSSILPPIAMLPLMAGLNLAALAALRGLGAATRKPADEEDATSLSGLSVIRAVPYLRDLAVLVALGALAEALLDYVLSANAVASYGRGGPLLAFFALLHTGVAVTGLLVQAVASRPCLERFGLAGTVALQPGGVIATAALGLLWPGLWTAIAVRGLEAVLHSSLYRSGYELLYTPLPLVQKRATKAIVDVGFDKAGSVLGGLLTAALLAILPGAAMWASLAGAIAVSAACLAILPRLHRGYVGSLEESLRSGSVRLDQEDVVDGTTRYTLARTGLALDRDTLLREIEGMRGRTPVRVDEPLLAAVSALRGSESAAARAALAAGLTPALVGHALPLLARDELAADAVRALRKVAPAVTGQLVDALVDPSQPDAVRRRLPRVLRVCANPLAALGLRLGLADRAFEVRYRCGQALAGIVEKSPELAPPRDVVFDEVKRELARLASRGADDDRRLEAVFTLLTLAVPREPVQIAYRALRSQDRALRGTALEYLENVLPEDMRAALAPHLDAPAPARRRRAAAEVEADLLRSGERLPVEPRRRESSD
jgi:ATP:ADP antiporter, AAA family